MADVLYKLPVKTHLCVSKIGFYSQELTELAETCVIDTQVLCEIRYKRFSHLVVLLNWCLKGPSGEILVTTKLLLFRCMCFVLHNGVESARNDNTCLMINVHIRT